MNELPEQSEPKRNDASSKSAVERCVMFSTQRLTEKEMALLSYGYCVGKEAGHHETVEGYFGSSGRPECHREDSTDFINELTSDDIEYVTRAYKAET